MVFGGRSDRCVLFGGGIDSRDHFSFTVCYGDWSLLSQDVSQGPKQKGDDTVRFTKQVCKGPVTCGATGDQATASPGAGLRGNAR